MQASTSENYGDPSVIHQQENYLGNVNPIGIRACYDEGKRATETIMFDYQSQYGTQIKIARVFNTYGPKMSLDDGRVVSNFIKQALLGLPITVYGCGSQTRSFCYEDDLTLGLYSVLNLNSEFPGPLNMENPQPLPSDDPQRRMPDISLANEKLNWRPVTDLETGLIRPINFISTLAATK